MLRHSRADTYWMNRKHKERDKNHGSHWYRYYMGRNVYSEQTEEDYLNVKNRFNLREYLRKAWDYIY